MRPLIILVTTDIYLNWTELLSSEIPVCMHRKIWAFSDAAWLKLWSIAPCFTCFLHIIVTARYRDFKIFRASSIATIPTGGPNSNFFIRCLCCDISFRIDSVWRAMDAYESLIVRNSSFLRVRSFGCFLQGVLFSLYFHQRPHPNPGHNPLLWLSVLHALANTYRTAMIMMYSCFHSHHCCKGTVEGVVGHQLREPLLENNMLLDIAAHHTKGWTAKSTLRCTEIGRTPNLGLPSQMIHFPQY